MAGKSFLGANQDLHGEGQSFTFGERKNSPGPETGRQDEGMDWHWPT